MRKLIYFLVFLLSLLPIVICIRRGPYFVCRL